MTRFHLGRAHVCTKLLFVHRNTCNSFMLGFQQTPINSKIFLQVQVSAKCRHVSDISFVELRLLCENAISKVL